jgi:hypothetical protein
MGTELTAGRRLLTDLSRRSTANGQHAKPWLVRRLLLALFTHAVPGDGAWTASYGQSHGSAPLNENAIVSYGQSHGSAPRTSNRN